MMTLAQARKATGKLDNTIGLMESLLSANEAEHGQGHQHIKFSLELSQQWQEEAKISAAHSYRRQRKRREGKNRGLN
jgi:hypothetical protein